MVGEVDVDVVRGVVGAVPGQFDPLPPDLQCVAVGEGNVRQRPRRVAVPQQEPPGLLVPDANHVAAENRGCAGVVVMVMGVDHVRHPVGHAFGRGDLVDGTSQVVADGRWRVEQHHAVWGAQERRLVDAVGDVVQVPLHAPDVISLLVQGRAER